MSQPEHDLARPSGQHLYLYAITTPKPTIALSTMAAPEQDWAGTAAYNDKDWGQGINSQIEDLDEHDFDPPLPGK